MSVIVLTPSTITISVISTLISAATTTITESLDNSGSIVTSTFTTTTLTTVTGTNLPSDGIFISTTVEILISVIFAILFIAITALSRQFKRVQSQKDQKETYEEQIKKLEEALKNTE